MKLAPFALERYFAPREFVARAQLSCSDCEALTLDDVVAHAEAELRDAWSALRLGYSESRGHPLLRAEVAAMHPGTSVEHTITCAPAEGILLAMLSTLAAGDRVVACAPAYQSLHEIARGMGCVVDEWPWPFDLTRLTALVRARKTKLVVVNFPHNPTGHVPSVDEWHAVVAAARDAGAHLFSDEMYRFLDLTAAPPLASAVELYDKAIVLGGLSKAFSAPGLRSGWLVSRDLDVIQRCAEHKDYTTICGNGPGELLSIMVLRQRARILARNIATIRANVAALERLVPGAKGPRAGCVAFVELDDGVTALADELFRETKMLLLPSSVFGAGDRHARFGLGRAAFATTLEEFATWRAVARGSG
ncbi:MAG: aminotransferase class I/II-fold pyridoxal phosphate-dependent enzyme [Deltaproteobacteria bacterium]|nr:aminotransferase class I/II-fold pyridoxal phosphate-dependent enzyme [Deltaproteobacteria bacterium]